MISTNRVYLTHCSAEGEPISEPMIVVNEVRLDKQILRTFIDCIESNVQPSFECLG